jgi:hypothetical protein
MMSPNQYERLARIGKRIVDHDRQTAQLLADPVIPIVFAWELRNRRGDRDYLRKVAHEAYGRPLHGDQDGSGTPA